MQVYGKRPCNTFLMSTLILIYIFEKEEMNNSVIFFLFQNLVQKTVGIV